MIGTHVVVTTSHQGVFAGVLESRDGDSVVLVSVQVCVYWSKQTRGVLGLASIGPQPGSRVSPCAPRGEVLCVTSITQTTASARKSWEAAPWQ